MAGCREGHYGSLNDDWQLCILKANLLSIA